MRAKGDKKIQVTRSHLHQTAGPLKPRCMGKIFIELL